jgi:hypothetical protein
MIENKMQKMKETKENSNKDTKFEMLILIDFLKASIIGISSFVKTKGSGRNRAIIPIVKNTNAVLNEPRKKDSTF